MFMAWQQRYKVKDTAIDGLLAWLAGLVLPAGNSLPRSFYLLRQVLAVQSWQQFQVLQQLYANFDWVSAQDPTSAADLGNAKDSGTFIMVHGAKTAVAAGRSRSHNNLMLNTEGLIYVVRAIIPGPSHPQPFRPFLLAVVKDFKLLQERPQHNLVEVRK
eukprot:gene5605-5843_t